MGISIFFPPPMFAYFSSPGAIDVFPRSKYRYALLLMLMATPLHGCDCAQTPQTIDPNSASARVQAPTEHDSRARYSSADVRVPRKIMPGSSGIDVPMLDH